jgi:hypothetical protein
MQQMLPSNEFSSHLSSPNKSALLLALGFMIGGLEGLSHYPGLWDAMMYESDRHSETICIFKYLFWMQTF